MKILKFTQKPQPHQLLEAQKITVVEKSIEFTIDALHAALDRILLLDGEESILDQTYNDKKDDIRREKESLNKIVDALTPVCQQFNQIKIEAGA